HFHAMLAALLGNCSYTSKEYGTLYSEAPVTVKYEFCMWRQYTIHPKSKRQSAVDHLERRPTHTCNVFILLFVYWRFSEFKEFVVQFTILFIDVRRTHLRLRPANKTVIMSK
ncbi:hypothetical protein L9F63_006123, partial [Diploptera punctata]